MTQKLDRRPYITVTLDFFDHPKTLALSEPAQVHILRLWAYCGRYLTDGKVPAVMVHQRGPEVAAELLDGGWIEDRGEDGLWCHDYLDHQPSKEQVQKRLADKTTKAAEHGRRGAHTAHHVNKGVHDPSCPYCGPVPPAESDPGPMPTPEAPPVG